MRRTGKSRETESRLVVARAQETWEEVWDGCQRGHGVSGGGDKNVLKPIAVMPAPLRIREKPLNCVGAGGSQSHPKSLREETEMPKMSFVLNYHGNAKGKIVDDLPNELE